MNDCDSKRHSQRLRASLPHFVLITYGTSTILWDRARWRLNSVFFFGRAFASIFLIVWLFDSLSPSFEWDDTTLFGVVRILCPWVRWSLSPHHAHWRDPPSQKYWILEIFWVMILLWFQLDLRWWSSSTNLHQTSSLVVLVREDPTVGILTN